jgi:hypothetical protein
MLNAKNISLLKQQLESTGFADGLEDKLYAGICFRPDRFDILYSVAKGHEHIGFTVHFDIEDDGDYSCTYYDACLRREIVLPVGIIDGISITELDKKMASIEWDFTVQKNAGGLLETASLIEDVISNLQLLSSTPDGKKVADLLKFKYWSGTQAEHLIPALGSFKSQYETSQRFYLSEGNGITTEEAYRFLSNRWVEKKLLAQRKENGAVLKEGLPGGGVATSGKRTSHKRKIK